MALLARKISWAKWDGAIDAPIGADALSCDLKTAGNTLSFWRFPDEMHAYEEAALALAAGQRELDKIDIVGVDEVELQESSGVKLIESEGNTLVPDLKAYHVDVVELDIDRIAQVARLVARRVRESPNRVKRFSKKQVRDILARAVEDGRLRAEALEMKLLAALKIG